MMMVPLLHIPPPRSLLYLLGTLCTGLFGCSAPESFEGVTMSIANAPITVVREIRSHPFTLDDELRIGALSDMETTPTGFAISDATGFVLLVNEDFSLRARFGGEGSGPTELRFPRDLEVRGNAVAVFDAGNNRIAAINGAGELELTFPPRSDPPSDFAWLSDGSIVVRRGEGRAGLTHYHPSAKGAFGPQPPLSPDEVPDLSDPFLTADSSGRVHHYNSAQKLLRTYLADGTLAYTLRLPDATREMIASAQKDLEQGFGGRFMGVSFVLSLTTWRGHPVLVAPALPGLEALALVVEPERGVVTPVVAGPSFAGAPIPSPQALTLEGNVLTIANTSGLYQYEVRFPAHLQTG